MAIERQAIHTHGGGADPAVHVLGCCHRMVIDKMQVSVVTGHPSL